MRAACFISRSTCPRFNLAYENWYNKIDDNYSLSRLLNRRVDYDRILFLWRDSPCLVIGRNQVSHCVAFFSTTAYVDPVA